MHETLDSPVRTIVDLVEKVIELERADVFDCSSRRSLRSTCRRLREATDGTYRRLAVWTSKYSENLWASRLLDSCEDLTIDLGARYGGPPPSVDPNAVVLALATAALPRLDRLFLDLTSFARSSQTGIPTVPLDLTPLRSAAWVRRIKRLFLGINAVGADCSIFDDLHFEQCSDVTLHTCTFDTSGAGFWRCLGRCGALRKLRMHGTDASEADFAGFLAASTRLEEFDVAPKNGPAYRVCPAVIRALAAAAMPALRSVSLHKIDPDPSNLFRSSPWLKTVDTLTLSQLPEGRLADFLAGTHGGSLRVLHARLTGLLTSFPAYLPNLEELSLGIYRDSDAGGLGHYPWQISWDASFLFTTAAMPALERLKLSGIGYRLIVPDQFAEADAISPALSHLEVNGFRLRAGSAAALGGRLPFLTRFGLVGPYYKVEGEDSFIGSSVCNLLNAAAERPGAWVLESLKLGDCDYLHDEEEDEGYELEARPATLPALEKLIKLAPRMPHLKKCYFYAAGVGTAGSWGWAWAAQRGLWPQLEVLMVGDVGQEGLDAMAGALGGFKNLKKLIFGGTRRDGFNAAEAFPGVVLKRDVGGRLEYDDADDVESGKL